MASYPSDALIPWDPPSNPTVVRPQEVSCSTGGKWTLVLHAFSSPCPGRTLDRLYTSLGQVLEKQANRAAYNLGLGPHIVAQKIKSYFGHGEERVQRLGLLQTAAPPKLQKRCIKLLKYTVPTESAGTQSQAFKDIVDLVTLFPGLRALFACALDNATSMDTISAAWDRPPWAPDKEWTFWQTLAATCLTNTVVSSLLEGSPVSDLTDCSKGSLTLIEQLLIERDCSGASKYSSALCIRYLAGILKLPGFWSDTGFVHAHVANKLCCEMVRVLKDMGVDVLTLGLTDESEAQFDYEGVDFLATSIVNGVSEWLNKLGPEEWTVQAWYESFTKFLQLLRKPRAAELLPDSSSLATRVFEEFMPTLYRDAELNITVESECELADHQDTSDNVNDLAENSPPSSFSLKSIPCNTSEGDDDVHNIASDSVPDDDGDTQSQLHATTSEESENTIHGDQLEDIISSSGRTTTEQSETHNSFGQHDDRAAQSQNFTTMSGGDHDLTIHDDYLEDDKASRSVLDLEASRLEAIANEHHQTLGRVLDNSKPEDRTSAFPAFASSNISFRWQQVKFLGAGASGSVYSAVNLDNHTAMAVKEIKFPDLSGLPDLYAQIKDELSVMEQLHHPNIVEYYGIEVHRDKIYVFEELCQGGSLATLLERGRIEDESLIQTYTMQMLDGLAYLHSRGIVHRDVKPDHILLDHRGMIKFVDFGATKILAESQQTMQGTQNSLTGTPMYMSPEVIKNERRVRHGAMDIWSLGCIVLEFATGKKPWSNLNNEWAIMFHVGVATQPPPLPEPDQLSSLGIAFIKDCLTIDPMRRPSADELKNHLWLSTLHSTLATYENAEARPDGENSFDNSAAGQAAALDSRAEVEEIINASPEPPSSPSSPAGTP
ncbi:Protein kinase domain-containing protein [Mycena venus]|uniref:Protein kinase domain-containing protein n=1 Tax=Mycena venus TaxID=2733690 RepID=A0A8H7D202_9AGAR|nr:Protein kinase domain-containing protein [Mycena venus]